MRQAATFGVELQAVDLKDYEVEQLWKEHLVLFVLSTYENGSAPDSARYIHVYNAFTPSLRWEPLLTWS